jgi:sulfane dehydrogenase subunit SoxC
VKIGDDGLVIYDEKSQRMADELVMSEARQIAQRRQDTQDCACKDGMFPRVPASRRSFLFAAGSATSLAGSTAALAQKAPPGAVYFDAPADPTKEQGRPVAGDGGYGSRSQFETEVRVRFPTPNEYTSWSFTPLDKMLGNLTSSGLHFERHHGGIPTIDPANHALFVHGMVDTPKKFSMADLKRFPAVTRRYFVECSGNGLTEWNKPTQKTVQGTHGLLSTSEWTGVQFATIAREVGLKEGSTWVLAEGSDAAVIRAAFRWRRCSRTPSLPTARMEKQSGRSRAILCGCYCPVMKATRT